MPDLDEPFSLDPLTGEDVLKTLLDVEDDQDGDGEPDDTEDDDS